MHLGCVPRERRRVATVTRGRARRRRGVGKADLPLLCVSPQHSVTMRRRKVTQGGVDGILAVPRARQQEGEFQRDIEKEHRGQQ